MWQILVMHDKGATPLIADTTAKAIVAKIDIHLAEARWPMAHSVVALEPETIHPSVVRRVFRVTAADKLESCAYDTWQAEGADARWYGFSDDELPERE